LEGNDLVGFETGIDVLEAPETFDQESGADHERQGKGHFRDYEQRAETTAAAGGGAASFFQRRLEIGVGSLESRREPEEHAGEDRDA